FVIDDPACARFLGPLRGFGFRHSCFVAEFGGALQRRQGLEVPDALQVGVAIGSFWWGPRLGGRLARCRLGGGRGLSVQCRGHRGTRRGEQDREGYSHAALHTCPSLPKTSAE